MAQGTWQNEVVTVFSNSLSYDGSVNTPSKFNVKLPHPINLSGMEVGVRNVTFPTSWNPIAEADRERWVPRWCVTSKFGTLFANHAQTDKHAQWIGEFSPGNPKRYTMVFTLQNQVYRTANDVLRQMLLQTYAAFPSKHFPNMTFEKKVIKATHPRNVILESPQGRIWVNTPLRDMLCYGQNPNVPLEKKYLVTDGQHAGRLMTEQFLKQTGSHKHFHEPFVKVYTNDLSTFDVDNGIQLDQSSLRSSYSFPQIQNFLVYADFIKNRPVGSIRTGLLIAVNNPGLDARLYGASYSHFNSNPLFMPTEDVVRNNFNFVVRDDNGAIRDFDWGTTSLELHFRRRRNAKLGWSEMI